MLLAMRQMGAWPGARGENLLDGGAPFYDSYETRDGRHITVAALESRFYAELLDRLGLTDASLPHQHDRGGWSALRERLAGIFRTRTRDEWCRILEGTDACFAPVLGLDECATHPHNLARGVFVTVEGIVNPAPAPRFSRTPGRLGRPPPAAGADTLAALADWGFSPAELAALREAGAIA
jgi:alpha-methylacyl-CoA racemase